MTFKMLSVAAVAMTIAGSAFAQSESGSPRLDDATMMGQFYSDTGMTTLRTGDDFTNVVKGLKSEDREAIAAECKTVTTQRATFCDAFNASNGM